MSETTKAETAAQEGTILEQINAQSAAMGEELSTYPLLVQCNWFYAPDGNQYKAVWGTVRMMRFKGAFGFEPKAGTNWWLRVGKGRTAVLVAGCQIHYVTSPSREQALQNKEIWIADPPGDE